MASSTELSEDQVLAYLSKLSPDAATALLTKASGLSAEQPAEKAEQQTGQPAAERLEEDGEGNAATDVMRALAAGNIAEAQRLWPRANLEFLGEEGWSCLHWVVHAAGAALHLKSKAEEPKVGCDCCHAGASQVRGPALALLGELLERAPVNLPTSQGATALMFAADAGDEEVCDLLLHAGADPSATDMDGDDAAAWARARGHWLLALSIAGAS
ncbi:unnamed protein product [Durusdinium trenchii]|uniref:Cytochrome c domain-containing protein n=1 Tax=Durusdinium trenchii TaxID=1381693 RepID=A0ABP0NDH0_9DINO